MAWPTVIAESADRLGLELAGQAETLRIIRHGWTVHLQPGALADAETSPAHRARAAWFFMGLRLGLDKTASLPEAAPDTPLRFRRTSLRRYHEAPSVHGEHLPLLVPRLTGQTFEAICGEKPFSREWLQRDMEILVVHETGTRIDVLTEVEQRRSPLEDRARWDKSRSALFYQSYKVRPRRRIDVDGGSLRLFETREGYGATRALLLPEFDYDASREKGLLAVPSRDRIIVARPQDEARALALVSPLRNLVEESIQESHFPMTDALFRLSDNSVHLFEEPSWRLDETEPPVGELIDEIEAP